MSIRFKKYQLNDKSEAPVKGIRLTENNLDEVAEYVTRNGGAAFVTQGIGKPRRLRIKQLNFGENWGKRDWRVAKPGDFVVFMEDKVPADGVNKAQTFREYWRVREDHFEASHHEVK